MTTVEPPAPSPLDDLIPLVTRLAREAVEAAATGPLAGPSWRPGTVVNVGAPGADVGVNLDGDDPETIITAPNVSGAGLLAGSRVLVLFVPPQGIYITSAFATTAVAPGTVVWNVAETQAQMPGHLAFAQTVAGGQTDYPALWSRLPAAWKSGTSIVLPDIGSRTIVARSADARFDVTGEVGGVADVTLTAAQSGLPAHNHSGAGGDPFVMFGGNNTAGLYTYPGGTRANTTANSAAQNAAQSHTNLPPYVVLNPYLKT